VAVRRGYQLLGSSAGIFLLAAVLVAALLGAIEVMARLAHTSFVATVVLGTDKRTSTSKTFVFMWTLIVAWALAALLLAGEFVPGHSCVTAAQNPCSGDPIGLLQLGWNKFLTSGLDASYLVLLGIPAAAAIGAKAVTQSKVDAGTMPVVPLEASDRTLSARVTQIFSADDGSTDVADLQYVIFNLILASYFVVEMLRVTGTGLPHLPETLLGLTSVSAALYVGKKAATRTQPTISAVFPAFLVDGATITITGNGLTKDLSVPESQQPSNLREPQVTINGVSAEQVRADPNVQDRITARVPEGLNPGKDPISGNVEVLSAYGFKTPPCAVMIKGTGKGTG
jgi:hypothetical protein